MKSWSEDGKRRNVKKSRDALDVLVDYFYNREEFAKINESLPSLDYYDNRARHEPEPSIKKERSRFIELKHINDFRPKIRDSYCSICGNLLDNDFYNRKKAVSTICLSCYYRRGERKKDE